MAVLDLNSQELQPEADAGHGVRGASAKIQGLETVVEQLEAAPPELLVPGAIQLGTLSDPRLRVIAPIHVRLFEEHGQVVAEATDLSEFGFGSNVSEAMRDVQRAIAQLYFSLDQDRERLGSDLQSAWSTLERTVARVTPIG